MVRRPGVRSGNQLRIQDGEKVDPAILKLMGGQFVERILLGQTEDKSPIIPFAEENLRGSSALVGGPLHQSDLQLRAFEEHSLDTMKTKGRHFHVSIAPKGNDTIEEVDLVIAVQEHDGLDMTISILGILRELLSDAGLQFGVPGSIGHGAGLGPFLPLLEIQEIHEGRVAKTTAGGNEDGGKNQDDGAGVSVHFT